MTSISRTLRVASFLLLASGPSRPVHASPAPLIGGCDGCEAIFEGQPDRMSAGARIAGPGEPGEPLVLEGVVRDAAGRPRAGVIVYAYHTNAQGVYPRGEPPLGEAARRHGKLRGFARTDEGGHYRFETIRPAAYPGRNVPQHIHMQILEPGRCHYYIDDVVLTDDPLLTDAQRKRREGRGGSGISAPRRAPGRTGAWMVRRDIQLGAGVPGYARCGST
jgi:protocatechuate 3,4-dioxygenase beta subunit